MENEKTIGEKLKNYRNRIGMTLQELEKKSGVANPVISRIETGKVKPRRSTLEKLAKALNISIDELFGIQKVEDNREKELELFKTIFKDLLMDVSIKVPVYGTIPAGKPEEAGDGILEYIKMPKEIASTIDYALKVKGMSMVEAGIFEGSLVFVKVQSTADDGDIVVARKGNDYTIKRFRKTVSETWLEPASHNFAFGKSEFQIVGLVKYILRSLKE